MINLDEMICASYSENYRKNEPQNITSESVWKKTEENQRNLNSRWSLTRRHITAALIYRGSYKS